MVEYRITRKLRPRVAAYVAGLIDGEGTVTLSRRHANEQRQLVVSVVNTERPILRYLLDQIGTGKITNKRIVSTLHTPSYCYSVSNRQALALLKQVAPYLRSYKRQRAQLILVDYQRLTPRNGKYTAAARARRAKFENEVLLLSATSTSARQPVAEMAALPPAGQLVPRLLREPSGWR